MKRRDIIRLLGGAATWPFAARATVSDELLIDLKTANSLGITIPQALLSRADEVIRVSFATTVLTLATYCTAIRPQSRTDIAEIERALSQKMARMGQRVQLQLLAVATQAVASRSLRKVYCNGDGKSAKIA